MTQPYADLRERLLATETVIHDSNEYSETDELRNPDGPEAAEAISTLLDRCIALEGALKDIAGAPLYRTRSNDERICKAEDTRDVARATLSGTSK